MGRAPHREFGAALLLMFGSMGCGEQLIDRQSSICAELQAMCDTGDAWACETVEGSCLVGDSAGPKLVPPARGTDDTPSSPGNPGSIDPGSQNPSPSTPKTSSPSSKPPTVSPPPPDSCDAAFLGPFCTDTTCDAQGNCKTTGKNPRIIGFDTPPPSNPTLEQARQYSLAAVNAIRARTCLPPLVLDDCLNSIADKARAANASHGYFLAHCLNGAHNYGRTCECNWTQENIGASAGTSRTWVDGVHRPLCAMMTEPKGKGHRSNIEHTNWKRLGVSIGISSNGASWFHEFGCDASLASCPK